MAWPPRLPWAAASAPQNGTLEQQARFGGTTLADLESTDIIIEEQQLKVPHPGCLEQLSPGCRTVYDPERRAKPCVARTWH